MSNWTEVRDEFMASIHIDEVTEEMKKDANKWLLESGLPIAKKAASSFTAETRKQSENETGWCKIRDAFVLPLSIEALLWLAETALKKTAEV